MAQEQEDDKERRILRVMRQVLGEIVKDLSPRPGREHPLSEQTIENIRGLFALIAEREAELAAQARRTVVERPYFSDEAGPSAKPMQFHKTGKKPH